MSVDRSTRALLAVILLVAALFVAMNRIADSAPAVDWGLPLVLFVVGAGLLISLRSNLTEVEEEDQPALPASNIHTYLVPAAETPVQARRYTRHPSRDAA